MEADLSKPLRRETILSGVRRVCAPAAVFAAASAAVLIAAWLTFRQPAALALACGFAGILAWEIYPRPAGVRYSTGWRKPDRLTRDICLLAMSRGLKEDQPIQAWHPDFFALIQTPSDGSIEELWAASWNYTYALLDGDLEAAARFIECQLALFAEERPATRYITLGDALHFYTAVALDANKTRTLLAQIREIRWELEPRTLPYIDAAIALAEDRRADAVAIAQNQLDRIGAEGGTAGIQLQRELLTHCRHAAAR